MYWKELIGFPDNYFIGPETGRFFASKVSLKEFKHHHTEIPTCADFENFAKVFARQNPNDPNEHQRIVALISIGEVYWMVSSSFFEEKNEMQIQKLQDICKSFREFSSIKID